MDENKGRNIVITETYDDDRLEKILFKDIEIKQPIPNFPQFIKEVDRKMLVKLILDLQEQINQLKRELEL